MQGGLILNKETMIGIAIVIVILLLLLGGVLLLTNDSKGNKTSTNDGEPRLSTWVIFKLLFVGELDERKYPNHYLLKSLVYVIWLILIGSVIYTFIDILF